MQAYSLAQTLQHQTNKMIKTMQTIRFQILKPLAPNQSNFDAKKMLSVLGVSQKKQAQLHHYCSFLSESIFNSFLQWSFMASVGMDPLMK